MLLTTGSQGERRAATAQLSRGKYQGMSLKEGDLFLFSSKTIPGNEKGVIRIINQLSEMGVDVVDDSSGDYHVSGHANRPDLEKMHEIMISEEEIHHSVRRGNYYAIRPMLPELRDGEADEASVFKKEFSSADNVLDLAGTIDLLRGHQLLPEQQAAVPDTDLLR